MSASFLQSAGTRATDKPVPQAPSPLKRALHRAFIKRSSEDSQSFAFAISEHLRMSGVYWGLSALYLINGLGDMDRGMIIDFVISCQHEGGGFSGNVGHDPHMLYTLSAIQILVLFDALDRVEPVSVLGYVAGKQQPDGSFFGDEWGEVDTRFTYCALCCASLLGRLDALDVSRAVGLPTDRRDYAHAVRMLCACCVPAARLLRTWSLCIAVHMPLYHAGRLRQVVRELRWRFRLRARRREPRRTGLHVRWCASDRGCARCVPARCAGLVAVREADAGRYRCWLDTAMGASACPLVTARAPLRSARLLGASWARLLSLEVPPSSLRTCPASRLRAPSKTWHPLK